MECSRCGKCCCEAFYRHVAPEDLERWEQAGRTELIEAYQAELDSNDRSNPAMAELGLAFHTCGFLRPDGPGRFFCAIHEERPAMCRDFEVGCSRLCPNYRGKKRKPEE